MFARSRRHCRSSWRRHCGGQQLARSALQLFGVIPDPKAIGAVHLRLARRAATPEEAAEHREARAPRSPRVNLRDSQGGGIAAAASRRHPHPEERRRRVSKDVFAECRHNRLKSLNSRKEKRF
jgi:hypothetical protein